jgi:protein SCO1/2
MKNLSRRELLGMAGAAAVGAGLLALPSGKKAWAATTPRDLIREDYLPNTLLTNHEGEQVRFYDDLIKDKFVTINMVYTSCKMTCPLVTANLVRVQKLLADRVGRDLFMYSITIDPKRDTPKVLKKYAKTHGVGKGWQFLTGKPDDIEDLRIKLGFRWANPVRDANKDFHTGNLRYGNEPLMLWGMVPGIANPSWVAKCILFADQPKTAQANQPDCCSVKA